MFKTLTTWFKNLFAKPAEPVKPAPVAKPTNVADTIKRSVTEHVTAPEATVKPKRPNRRKKSAASKHNISK